MDSIPRDIWYLITSLFILEKNIKYTNMLKTGNSVLSPVF